MNPMAARVRTLTQRRRESLTHHFATVSHRHRRATNHRHLTPINTIRHFRRLQQRRRHSALRVAFQQRERNGVQYFRNFRRIRTSVTIARLIANRHDNRRRRQVIVKHRFIRGHSGHFIRHSRPTTFSPTYRRRRGVLNPTRQHRINRTFNHRQYQRRVNRNTTRDDSPYSRTNSTLNSTLP